MRKVQKELTGFPTASSLAPSLSSETDLVFGFGYHLFPSVMRKKEWPGFLGQGTWIYKWETALGSFSCRNLPLRESVTVNHSRGLSVKVLVPSFFVVKLEVDGQSFLNLHH